MDCFVVRESCPGRSGPCFPDRRSTIFLPGWSHPRRSKKKIRANRYGKTPGLGGLYLSRPFMSKNTENGIIDSILDLIGNTPLLRLSRISAGTGAEILAKLEFLNPSGSIKDRMALRMIADAEAQGRIQPG